MIVPQRKRLEEVWRKAQGWNAQGGGEAMRLLLRRRHDTYGGGRESDVRRVLRRTEGLLFDRIEGWIEEAC